MKYIVKRGDTLFSLAKKNKIDLMQLLGANKQIENPDRILVGQEINIPSSAKQEPTTQKKFLDRFKKPKEIKYKILQKIIFFLTDMLMQQITKLYHFPFSLISIM